MNLLYVTADKIGGWEGGAQVTFHESEALKSLGDCTVLGKEQLEKPVHVPFANFDFWAEAACVQREGRAEPSCEFLQPWVWDGYAYYKCKEMKDHQQDYQTPKLAHFYSGTFSYTVSKLKEQGTKVSYTIAAHDIARSRAEHERLGFGFPYPHLTDPALWERYARGYREADLVICPSTVAAATVRAYGGCDNVVVIPHGCNPVAEVAPLPQRFTVGYLGSYGIDKGVDYLLQAWGKLKYKDAVLILAGRDSTSSWVKQQVQKYGGNVILKGWVENVADFYNSISLLVQPSVTEGFGLEVLEALAHGRPVLCSDGAGAADVVAPAMRFPACDADALADAIQTTKAGWMPDMEQCRRTTENYTWDKIRERYVTEWKKLLGTG